MLPVKYPTLVLVSMSNDEVPEIPTTSGIYLIFNELNGKAYVGSALNLRARRSIHRTHLKRNAHHSRHLQAAWIKYGPDNFTFRIIEFVEVKEELVSREQHYLDLFGTCKGDIGYNISPTAGSPLGIKRTDETRRKISEAKKRELADPERYARMVELRRRQAADPEYHARLIQRCQDPEYRAKLSESTSKQMESPERRAQSSEVLKQRWDDPEERERLLGAIKEARSTPEFIEKNNEHCRKMARNPEIIAKIVSKTTGKKRSLESRIRMSNAQKKNALKKHKPLPGQISLPFMENDQKS